VCWPACPQPLRRQDKQIKRDRDGIINRNRREVPTFAKQVSGKPTGLDISKATPTVEQWVLLEA